MFKKIKRRKKKKDKNIRALIIISTIMTIMMIWGAYNSWSIQETLHHLSVVSYKVTDVSNKSYKESYGGITFQVTIGMLIAIQTISITIFVFLKSLLDSKKEEQIYSKRTMDIYIKQMSILLFFLIILSVCLLGHGFLFYNGKFYMDYRNQTEVFLGWLFPLLLFVVLSFYFWFRCINNNRYWIKIITIEKWNIELDVEETLNTKFEECDNYLNGKIKNSSDFISLFSKIEELLMCGVDSQFDIFNNNEERIQNHLKQVGDFPEISINIENSDLTLDENLTHIADLRATVSQNNDDIIWLYQYLEIYRDLLLLEQSCTENTQVEFPTSMQNGLNIFNILVLNNYIRNIVLTKVIFEAATFLYADLYCTRIVDSVFTGVKFDKSVVARMQVEKSNMNMGIYMNLWFTNVKFRNCSLVGTKFKDTAIINSEFVNDQLNNSEFAYCEITQSSFEGSDLSDTEFNSTYLHQINFSNTILKRIFIKKGTQIKDCNFEGAEITGWYIEENVFLFSNQNFSKTNLDYFKLKEMDASSDVFFQASMFGSNFQNNNMQHCIFEEADLTESVFQNVDLSASIFKKANLHKAQIDNCKLSFCDLEKASITAAIIRNSTFKEASCFFLDLTQTNIKSSSFRNAILDKTIFVQCIISNCIFWGMRGEGMTLHSTKVYNCKFKNAIFRCADIKQVSFYQCNFENVIFENVITDVVVFKACEFKNAKWINTLYARNIKLIKCKGLKRRTIK